MIHVRKKHATFVGQGLHYWQLAVPIQSRMQWSTEGLAWHLIPWPKSLPALPSHRSPRSDLQWDPETEIDYIQHPDEDDFRIFEGLEALEPPESAIENMEEPFVHAINILSSTRLDATCAFRIAIEYAKQLMTQNSMLGEEGPTFELGLVQLQNLQDALRTLSLSYDFRFKCALCMNSSTRSPHGRPSREIVYTQSLSQLTKHWKKKHKSVGDIDSATDLVYLPSDAELLKAIQSEDEKLINEKRRATQTNLSLNPILPDEGYDGRSNDPRADATLRVPMISDCIRMLFKAIEKIDAEEECEEAASGDLEDPRV